MTAFLALLRWDIVVQARNGFYWATAFLVVVVGGLLLALPEAARSNTAAWVPALVAMHLQTTTFFFVAGLMLLERDEGTLSALAVSPSSPGDYLGVRTISLTTLAAVETLAVVWIGFGMSGGWLLMLSGMAALGAVYTGIGAAVAARYTSVNTLLLPASMVVTLLLLPLIPHFGLGPRWLVLLHPIEPPLTLIRAAYSVPRYANLAYGVAGLVAWGMIAFLWGRRSVGRVMRDTRAGGGR